MKQAMVGPSPPPPRPAVAAEEEEEEDEQGPPQPLMERTCRRVSSVTVDMAEERPRGFLRATCQLRYEGQPNPCRCMCPCRPPLSRAATCTPRDSRSPVAGDATGRIQAGAALEARPRGAVRRARARSVLVHGLKQPRPIHCLPLSRRSCSQALRASPAEIQAMVVSAPRPRPCSMPAGGLPGPGHLPLPFPPKPPLHLSPLPWLGQPASCGCCSGASVPPQRCFPGSGLYCTGSSQPRMACLRLSFAS